MMRCSRTSVDGSKPRQVARVRDVRAAVDAHEHGQRAVDLGRARDREAQAVLVESGADQRVAEHLCTRARRLRAGDVRELQLGRLVGVGIDRLRRCEPFGAGIADVAESDDPVGLDSRELTPWRRDADEIGLAFGEVGHLTDSAPAQTYASADLGLIAYESVMPDGTVNEGMILDERLILEIVRPGTGDPVQPGEVGEVVITSFNKDYPLIRFATGDLSAVLPGTSPCGRTNVRIKGWMGRADQSTKVRAMFVTPRQIADIAAAPPRNCACPPGGRRRGRQRPHDAESVKCKDVFESR